MVPEEVKALPMLKVKSLSGSYETPKVWGEIIVITTVAKHYI